MIENCSDVKEYTTGNGINIVTIKKNTEISSVHMGIKIGSLYEKENDKGISHFIEHMLFKGTSTRDNEKLNDDLEQIGGEYNAYTEYTSTVYEITALNDEIENSIEVLSDMLQNATFPESEIEKERKVILAEIRTSRDDIEDYSFIKTNEVAFKNSPLKINTMGMEDTVEKFTRLQIMKFYKEYYVPNNCFIVVVSPFEHEKIINMIVKYFNSWKRQEFRRNDVLTEKNIPVTQITYKKDIELSTISYLFTFYNLTRFQELVLKTLNHKFGAGGNSILFRRLREDNGYAYDAYSDVDTSKYVKTLYIYTGVSSKHIDDSLKIINDCINKIKNKEFVFDDSTINLMKKVLKTAVAATMEDSAGLGNYVLHQKIDSESTFGFIEDINNLENIKREDIYDVANLVFNNPTIHMLIPEKSE